MGSIIEFAREMAVSSLFRVPTFRNSWPTWKSSIVGLIGPSPSATTILNLGDNLSQVFRTTSTPGRTQGLLSAGGTAWECLVCWYLNLCLLGSRVVVMRQSRDLLPDPIRNAIQVNYGTFPSNTESDLVAITFPNRIEYTGEKEDITIEGIPNIRRGNFNYKQIINSLVATHITDFEVGIIQCKTNWKDNAQVPMLWDMVYSSSGFPARNISIGSNGYTITDFSRFNYSFATVPSNINANYNPNSTPVKRVCNLSGGNYWGKPSQSGVASSLKEVFTRNFTNGATVNIRTDLASAIPDLSTTYSYFDI